MEALGLRAPFTLVFDCQVPEGAEPPTKGAYRVGNQGLELDQVLLVPVASEDGRISQFLAHFN